MALQQNRIIRFLMVLTAVLLTIFIYASYYSNTVMTLPARLHTSPAASSASSSATSTILSIPTNNNNNNNNNDKYQYRVQDNNINSNDNSNIVLIVDKQNSGKNLQHFSNSEFELNNTMYGRSYVNDSLIASLPALSSSSSSSSSFLANSVQKNSRRNLAGAISNVTAAVVNNSSTVGAGVALTSNHHLKPISNTTASTPLMVMPKMTMNQTKPRLNAGQIDPLKGVRTSDLYESGHMDMGVTICQDMGERVKLLVLITSAPKNQEARLAIRQTWGHYGNRRDVAVAFVLGRTLSQPTEDALTAEMGLYGDLIRGHFIDSYNNLTLKTVSILEWTDRWCPKASFILKTDDDMFINIPKLLAFVEKHRTDKRTIYGRLAKKWKPIRNQKSKYYVSPIQFAAAVYPQFTTGPAYLLTADVIRDLYVRSLEQTYLKLEDVYTTGIVAQLLNIKRIHVNEFLNRRIAFNPCNIRKAISVHMIKSNEQFDLWKKLLDTSAKCK